MMKRVNVLGKVDFSSTNVCAILGNFTADGVDIIYKNLPANVLNFEHVDLKRNDENESATEPVKRGKYVR
jgi:hypothetical protein